MKREIKIKIGDVIKGTKREKRYNAVSSFINVIDSNSPSIEYLKSHFKECERRGYKIKKLRGKKRWEYLEQYGLFKLKDVPLLVKLTSLIKSLKDK